MNLELLVKKRRKKKKERGQPKVLYCTMPKVLPVRECHFCIVQYNTSQAIFTLLKTQGKGKCEWSISMKVG